MDVELEAIGPPPDGMINPALVDDLNEFKELVRCARASRGQPSHERHAKKLCESSRTVLFRLGPPGWVSGDMRDYIAELFRLAIEAMDTKNSEVRGYANNVRKRTKDVMKTVAPEKVNA
jgi:hypothetical protein